jgi:O-antigen ligase
MVRTKFHVLGVGPGCFQLARGRYFGFSMESHNLYGQIIGELGIPGSIAWFFLIWQTYKNLQTVRREQKEIIIRDKNLYFLATGLVISILIRLIVGQGSHGLYFFYWYITAALSALILNISQTQNSDTENG